MSWFSKKEEYNSSKVAWVILDSVEELVKIKEQSNEKPIAIFKHSTRCSISSMAKSKLERDWDLTADELVIYYLDLIQFRSVSNEIASFFSVEHQSPQILLIKKGEVTYHTSHSGISALELKKQL